MKYLNILEGMAASSKIHGCILKHWQIEKIQATPNFLQTIKGCFVRFAENENFKIAQIADVRDFCPNSPSHHDHIYATNKKILILDDGTEKPMDSISDEPAEESEIHKFLMESIGKVQPFPTEEDYLKKSAEINAALSWPLASNKDLEIANNDDEKCNPTEPMEEGRNEEEMPLFIDEENQNEETIENEEIIQTEENQNSATDLANGNVEMNEECQMEVEIGQNVENTNEEEVNSPSHGGAEISADDIKCSSIDEELLMEEEMKNKEQNQEMMASTSTGNGQFELPISQSSSRKISAATDESGEGGIMASTMSKKLLKQKEMMKKIENLDQLLPIILSKTQIIQLIHLPKFHELVKDCFVRIKLAAENNEEKVEKQMLAKLMETKESEKMKVMDDELYYNIQFCVSCPNVYKIFEVDLENILDEEPTEEEFKELSTIFYPNLKLITTKEVQLKNAIKNSTKKDKKTAKKEGKEEWNARNEENKKIFEKQKMLTTREEFLQIYLRRSQLLRLVQKNNFTAVIGGFVRFLYNEPIMTDNDGQQSTSSTGGMQRKHQIKYKIMQIVGVQSIMENPYEVCRQIVDKNLKLEWDKEKMIENAKISSISESPPEEKEFKEWLESRINNNHNIPSLHFVKSKSATIKAAMEFDEQKMELDQENNKEEAKPAEEEKEEEEEKRRRPKLERRAKLAKIQQPTEKKAKEKDSPKNAKKNVTFSAEIAPAAETLPTQTLPSNQPKGFEILNKSLKRKLDEKKQIYEETMTGPSSFWNSLSKMDKRMLKQNGFVGKVRVWINKNECDKQFLNLLNERDKLAGGPSTSKGKGKSTKQPLKIVAKSSKASKPNQNHGGGSSSSSTTEGSGGATAEVRTGAPINFISLANFDQPDIKYPI